MIFVHSLGNKLAIVAIASASIGGFAPGAIAAPQEDRPPELLATTGGAGGGWANVQELAAAAQGENPEAWAQYGEVLFRGDVVPANVDLARTYLEKAARAGKPSAAFRLGMMNTDGVGGPRDAARGLAYFKAAAAGGIGEATFNVGAAYASGRGVKRDYAEALAWIIVARTQGAENPEAEQALRARIEKLRRPEWIKAGEERAPQLQEELARRGVTDFLPPVLSAASASASASATTADAPPTVSTTLVPSPSLSPAPIDSVRPVVPRPSSPSPLGPMPAISVPGLGTEGSSSPAPALSGPPIAMISPTGRRWRWPALSELERSAERRDPLAMGALGQLYVTGKFVEADVDQGVIWLERAAAAGDRDGAHVLGELYAAGSQVVKDDARALQYTTQAAEAGSLVAIYNLGGFYANGRGGPRDYTEALSWLLVAKRFGVDRGAVKRIRDHLLKTAPDQIPVAEKRAEERIARIEPKVRAIGP